MTLDEACKALGVSPSDDWPTVRHAYRMLIRDVHPDVGGTARGIDASTLTVAFATLRAAHDSNNLPVDPPAVPSPAGSAPTVVSDAVLLHIPANDPFVHLLDVAHRLGVVTYHDRSAGLFQVLVDGPGTARCQLTGEVTSVGNQVQVQFWLEPLGLGPVPAIADVVARFGELSRMG